MIPSFSHPSFISPWFLLTILPSVPSFRPYAFHPFSHPSPCPHVAMERFLYFLVEMTPSLLSSPSIIRLHPPHNTCFSSLSFSPFFFPSLIHPNHLPSFHLLLLRFPLSPNCRSPGCPSSEMFAHTCWRSDMEVLHLFGHQFVLV